jgi:hypothetical protein
MIRCLLDFVLHIGTLHLMLVYSYPKAPILWPANDIIPDIEVFLPEEPPFDYASFDITSDLFNDIVIDSDPSRSLQSFCQSKDIFPNGPLQARDGSACVVPSVPPDLVKDPSRALEQLLPPLAPKNGVPLPHPAVESEALLESKDTNTCLEPQTHLCREGPEAPNGAKQLFTMVEDCDHDTCSHA